MRIKKILSYILVVTFFSVSFVNAQKNTKTIIKGKVMDSIGRPIVNASVFVDDKKTDIKTNAEGDFKLKLKTTPLKLMFLSSVYGVKEVLYDGEKDLEVIYVKDSMNINLALNQPVKKKKRKKEKAPMMFNTVYDYFRARVSGVQVSSDNRVVIRGITSFNSSTDPLFVVNGSPVSNIIDIDPNQIKSVTIIKDSKAAEYGVRGANGVIIINLMK